MASDREESADSTGGDVSPDRDDSTSTPFDETVDPAARTNPVIDSLVAGLLSDDTDMGRQCAVGLALVAENRPKKVSTVISRLVPMLVDAPDSRVILTTLASLVDEHGREIRGALITETGYTNARRLYGRLEHTEGWDLGGLDVEAFVENGEPSFLSAMMRVIELDSEGRDPLDSSAWTLFIQRLPGEGGDPASEEEIELAAQRHDSRPRSVKRKDRALRQIANSRTFRMIEARSRFDELEVLSTRRQRRFATVIRVRGWIGAKEHALSVRLLHQAEDTGFRASLQNRLEEWEQLDDESIVSVLDWGETPRPWIATELIDRTLNSQAELSTTEVLEHARTLTRALVALHRRGIVHGGIDPGSIGYPPNTLDGIVDPKLDHIGLLPVYRRYTAPDRYLDGRYGGPEWYDSQFGRVDRATDIYQLGMVLYRAATGTAPFDGGEDGTSIQEIVSASQPPPPSEHDPNLPAELDDILAKATAKQKLLRYETTVQFHQEVRALCEREGV